VPPAAEKRFAKQFKLLMQSLDSFNKLRRLLSLRTLKALSYQLLVGVQVCHAACRPTTFPSSVP
jgi:hypothetical protein